MLGDLATSYNPTGMSSFLASLLPPPWGEQVGEFLSAQPVQAEGPPPGQWGLRLGNSCSSTHFLVPLPRPTWACTVTVLRALSVPVSPGELLEAALSQKKDKPLQPAPSAARPARLTRAAVSGLRAVSPRGGSECSDDAAGAGHMHVLWISFTG